MKNIKLQASSKALGEVDLSFHILKILLLILAVVTVTGGTVIFGTRELGFAPLIFVTGYACILLAIVYQTACTRDPFNPLTLILSLALLRFGLPYLLFLIGASRPYAVRHLINLLGLTESHLVLAHVLWLSGMNALAFGWFVFANPLSRLAHPLNFSIGPYGTKIAIALMIFGATNIVIFVSLNADILQVVKTGSFRGQQIQAGTGKYWYLGLSAISASSVLSSAILARTQVRGAVALGPAFVAMVLFWILGGRARALTPVVICVLLVWYRWASRTNQTIRPFRILTAGAALIPVLAWFVYFSNLYQRGFGFLSVPLSFRKFPRYISSAAYADIGDFQGIAGAVAVGGGKLGGRTFGVLLWPLSEALPVGKSTGVYIVQSRIGTDVFGVGPSILGDAYVNFGFIGFLVVPTLFGIVLRQLYEQFRKHKLRPAIYAIIAVYAVRITFESINKWSELVTVTGFAVAAIAISVFSRTVRD